MNKDRFEPDAATLVSDDELLDALGRGEWPSKDDEPLALAFALWRDDIVRPAAAPSPEVQPARKAKHGNKFRWGLISGVVAALLGSGLAFAAVVEAQPGDGPIWGISERFFPERAQGKSVAAAQLALVEARTAISEDRLDLAERKVSEAEGLIGKVKSLTEVQQLQAELAVVRDLLNTARVRLGTVVPAPSGEPGLPIPAPAPSGGLPLPTPSVPGSPQPSSSSGGGLLPPLPSLLPSLPLPSIKLPL